MCGQVPEGWPTHGMVSFLLCSKVPLDQSLSLQIVDGDEARLVEFVAARLTPADQTALAYRKLLQEHVHLLPTGCSWCAVML